MLKKRLATVTGPWNVSFPPNWGAPSSYCSRYSSLVERQLQPGVKYFSGTGTYTGTVHASAAWFLHGTHIRINLGEVKNLTEVSVNGKPLGIVWYTPYEVDATSAPYPGNNTLVIEVTNSWVNRLIGDQQPNAVKTYTFTDYHPYSACSALLPSGLVGPVTVDSVTTK